MKTKKPLILISIFLGFLVGNINTMAEGKTVKIGTGKWHPFLGEKLPKYCPLGQVLKEAFTNVGHQVKFQFLPWKRSLTVVKKGELDMTPGWIMFEDRRHYFHASDTLFKSPVVFFHRKNIKFDWQKFEDFKKYSIGATIGYRNTIRFDQAVSSGLLMTKNAPTDIQNLKKFFIKELKYFL